jgi:hypothetical protein
VTATVSDSGSAYILNMCDQDVTVTLNAAPGPAPIPMLGQSGAAATPYVLSAVSAPRVPDPAPFQAFALGSGDTQSTNSLEYYLGDDGVDTRTITISLTQDDLHLEKDCQIFLFYESAVLRFAGNARFYPTNTTKMMEA